MKIPGAIIFTVILLQLSKYYYILNWVDYTVLEHGIDEKVEVIVIFNKIEVNILFVLVYIKPVVDDINKSAVLFRPL